MTISPEEQAALDGLTTATGFMVGTVIHGFETREDQVMLTVPVPRGPGNAVGQRITIRFEETA